MVGLPRIVESREILRESLTRDEEGSRKVDVLG